MGLLKSLFSKREYDGAGFDRSNNNWVPVNQKAEQGMQGSRDILRARARDLEGNSDIMESTLLAFERNVIGTGMTMQSKVTNSLGEEDKPLNMQIESLFNAWCKHNNCDVTGTQSFYEMQQMIVRRMKVDGGILIVKCYTDHGNIPLQLQCREVDDIDTTRNTMCEGVRGNRIINGVELTEYDRPVAYYLKKYTPDGIYVGEAERVPAENVILAFRKKRPSQIREISEVLTAIQRIKDVNEFSKAVSVKERILACLSVFIKKKDTGGGTLGRNSVKDNKSGYKIKNITPGMVQYLDQGDDVTAINPSGQASNAREFIMTQQRMIGAGQGLSYEVTARDMSQVNYSSARQGLLEDQCTYKMLQNYIKEHICERVFEWFMDSCVECGKLQIRDYYTNKEDYLKSSWVTQGFPWIDPLKESKANIASINACMDTLENVCGASGKDWKEVLEQRAKEIEYAKSLGIAPILTEKGGEQLQDEQGQEEKS